MRGDAMDTWSPPSLTALFAPQSIAVVGASDTVTKIGGIPLAYHKDFGFTGRLHAVNPRGGRVQGLLASPTLHAIGEPVDLAILAVPQALVEASLDDALAAGVKGIVLFSSGYAEVGPKGVAAQARLRAQAQAAGIRLMGPNCLGFMNPRHNVYATFSPAPGVGRVAPGRIGLVSQSGAFGAYAYSMARERGIGLSLWATTGNEVDIQVADCLAWLAQDEGTDVIMAYLEGCRDGPRLRAALALAQARGKPVVMVKVGTTALGAAAAASHTASLAGDDAVYDAVFRHHGVLRARTLSEFFDLAASAAIAGRPRDRSIGLFTVSGGVGALMADEASAAGLDVRPLSDAAQETLRGWVPFAAPRNPVDITGQVTNDPSLLKRSALLMLDDQPYAMWLGFLAAAGASDTFWPVLRAMAVRLRQAHPEAVIAFSTLLSPSRRAELEGLGCLAFTDPSVALRTLAALAGSAPLAEGHLLQKEVQTDGVFVDLELDFPLNSGPLSEPDSLALLAAAGVPVIEHHLVQVEEEAALACLALGGEIALKVASADIPHKSDVGGVALGLQGEQQVREAFRRIQASVQRARPDARVQGMLAARMVRGDGVECIAGLHQDPVFGPVLMFGLGGVHVEVLRDVSLRVLPVSRDDVRAMVHEIRGFALLQGARGKPPVDLVSLEDALLALARLAQAVGDRLESAEINPLLARPAGQGGCIALDALVVGRGSA